MRNLTVLVTERNPKGDKPETKEYNVFCITPASRGVFLYETRNDYLNDDPEFLSYDGHEIDIAASSEPATTFKKTANIVACVILGNVLTIALILLIGHLVNISLLFGC